MKLNKTIPNFRRWKKYKIDGVLIYIVYLNRPDVAGYSITVLHRRLYVFGSCLSSEKVLFIMLDNWNYARENRTIFLTQREMGVFAAKEPYGVKTTKFNPCMD